MINKKECYPLTYPQKSIWHLEKLHSKSSIGNIAATLKIQLKLDFDALTKAINHFIKVNDALRIRISENEEGEPLQYVSEFKYRDFDILDFSGKHIRELYEWDSKISTIPLYKTDADLFYFVLIKVNENAGGFFVKLHHLISDAWTFVNLGNEIMGYYKAIISGQELEENSKPSYMDYIFSEQKYLSSERFLKDQTFWLNQFSSIPELTTIKSRQSVQNSIKADRKTFMLPDKLSRKIREHCNAYRTSIFSLFLGVMAIYMYRTKGDHEVVFGTPILNRSNKKEKETMGMFISTVPIRINIDDSLDYITFSEGINREWLSVLRHQRYPYTLLLKKLREKHPGLEKLYDIVISYQNAKFLKEEKDDQEGRWHQNGCQSDALYIHINDREDDGNIIVDYDYLTEAFYAKEIEFLHDHVIRLLWHAIDNPTQKLPAIEMISEKEKGKILYEFNDTKKEYPSKTIPQLFEEQAHKTPDDIALIFEDKEMTYRELNARSNQLASELRRYGIKANDVIGIMLSRSFELIIGILGILKAGGAYLPVDPEYPKERIEYMLQNSKTAVLLTEQKLGDTINFEGNILLVDSNRTITIDDSKNPQIVNAVDDLAYVIYTSGSTGKPKGVMIEHKAVVNFITGVTDRICFMNKTLLAVTTVSFDIFVTETILPLTCGAKVVLANEQEQKDPRLISKAIISKRVNMFQATPSRIQMILNDESSHVALANLDDLILTGEALPRTMLKKVKEITKARIFNNYGPTETTVWSTIKDLTDASDVDIGTPICNTKIYILDKHMNLVPIGKDGELYIGGEGLARGYIHNPALTAERFLPDPYMKGEKIYKTGDLARWFPKGDIECLGRADYQIKLRGFRIELGEIENQMMTYPSISKAVVIDRDNRGDEKYLCAYYVSEGEIDVDNLKTHLKKDLPYYMIPSYFIRIDRIPLTPNGKIDRRSLPEVGKDRPVIQSVQKLQTETEKMLSGIWKDILKVGRIGRESHFFELGGDSLNIITLMNQVTKMFSVELSFEDINKMPTLIKMAEYIDLAKKNAYISIPPVKDREYYPLSPSQKRIFILSNLEEKSLGYNMPFALVLEGQSDEERIEESFVRLIERHESLRTSFHIINGEPVQTVHKKIDFSIQYEECGEDDIDRFIKKQIKPYQLNTAPLIRVSMARINNNKRILFIDMHHIISDGISIHILLKEFASLYDGKLLPKPAIQYKDYAIWKNSVDLNLQEQYWCRLYRDEMTTADLHYDFERPVAQSYSGEKAYFSIGKDLAYKLGDIKKTQGVTAFMIAMAAFNILLSKYSGQEDIIVGTPVAGRNHPDLDEMVGMFVNTLALRGKPEAAKTAGEFLVEVKKSVLEAFENQDYPFEELVNKLKIPRNLNRNPLFDTMLVYRKMEQSRIECEGMSITQYEFDSGISKFDLTVEIIDTEGDWLLTIEYCTDLFKSDTIQRMGEHYVNVLNAISKNPNAKISDIEIMSPQEKNLILHEFNNTGVLFNREKTVQQFFEEQVEKTPHAIAVVFEDNQYTYRQLNEAANRLARYLREQNSIKGHVVGIMVSRSFEMIVGIMAVLKAGGCYLPIDPDYPEERIEYILKDSGANLVLTQKAFRNKMLSSQKIVDIYDAKIAGYSGENLPNINTGEDLAYIIYTSGSTGNPKGVMIRHRSIINFINGITDKINFNRNKTIICITTICFDIFVLETLLPLCKGLRIIIANKEEANNPNLLKMLLQKHNVDMFQSTPSRLELFINQDQFIDSLRDLSEMMVGGEAFPIQLLNKLKKGTKAQIYNMYGPTETTVWSTAKLLNNSSKITVGYPINNTQIYILDKNMQPVPLGVRGELFIGGDGLAEGYHNKTCLTRERFIKNPLRSNEVVYRTGDIARWLPNGDIELFGRNDFQVKIRGHRIEIGEIEKKLLDIPQIKEAVVIDFETDVNKYLCSFYVVRKNCQIKSKEIRKILQSKLPEYMIPSQYVQIQKIPLTPNGKIDRKKLPKPVSLKPDFGEEKEHTLSSIERVLVQIWKTILKKERVNVFDNFFKLGGDSLSVIQMQLEVFKYNWGVKTQDFYRFQTIRELSQHIKNSEGNSINYITNNVTISNHNTAFTEQLIKEKKRTVFNSEKGVLILGSTGFLGIHILKRLLDSGNTDIYCIIRKDEFEEAKKYLFNRLNLYFQYDPSKRPSNRLHVICGDITKENFGLNDKEYEKLGGKIGLVIHSAANVKHYGNYEDFYKTNVKGTQNVADFCLNNKLFLYHISTISVSGDMVGGEFTSDIFSEKHFYIGQNYFNNVYIRSKFEAEKIIYKTMAKGLDASVLRVGNLTGRYSDGHFQVNIQDNAFYNRIKVMMQMRIIPDTVLDMDLEFTPVDYCSEAIVNIIRKKEHKEVVYHLFNSNTITVRDFIKILEQMGVIIQVVEKNEFDLKLLEYENKKVSSEVLTGINEYLNESEHQGNRISVSSQQTENILKEMGFIWPSTDKKYVMKLIEHMDQYKTKGGIA